MPTAIRLVHAISDTNIGGAGRYLLTYLSCHDRESFDVSVIVPKGSRLTDEIKKLGFRVVEAEAMADRSVSVFDILKLYKILRREKPHIVHTHAALSARIAARLAGVPRIVYTRHSVFPQKKYLTSGLGKRINGFAARLLSDGIIAVAGAAAKNLTDTGISEKNIRIIYNGVEPLPRLSEEEKDGIRRKFGISPDEKIVAIIARLEAVKGHEYFIEAAGLVKKAGIKARFVIAGTGSRYEELKRLVEGKNLSDTVLFTGFLNNVSELENIMDIQANASYGTEAASLSLLEGMSLGKPAVVSDFGGNPELIEDGVNGFVVPIKNSQAMADAIIRLLTDEALMNDMSKRSVEIFESRFTSQIMTQKMEQFYKSLTEGVIII
ncbi:MAG: Alpha-D-kanosaminyltransferase [Firmicutes bacterium ADurb.Bin193]|nr:MAG: Alpha-D-kanosaminyltransferase [Firmicutes bacterium ADurb.Bin193]